MSWGRQHAFAVLPLLAGVAVSACGDDGGSAFDSATATATASTGASATDGTATTEGTATDSSGPATDSAGAGTTDGSGTTGGIKLDVGYDTDGGNVTDGSGQGCEKVDILFVIDNSPSMYDEQQKLINNFDTFVTDIQTALVDVEDYHVGVISTDDYSSDGGFDDGWDVINEIFPECQVRGGLVKQNGFSTDCTPLAGGNYMTQDDLDVKFQCVANLNENGDSDEKVLDSISEAIGPTLTAAGACNDGFFRSDAPLVLVILTDENDVSDKHSSGGLFPSLDLEAYRDELVAFKGGDINAVVVLTLTWDSSYPGCTEDLSETDGYEVREFAELFPTFKNGNICENSYAGFFSDVVGDIKTTCDDFVPPG